MKRTIAAAIVLGLALASWAASAQQRQAGAPAAPGGQSPRAQTFAVLS